MQTPVAPHCSRTISAQCGSPPLSWVTHTTGTLPKPTARSFRFCLWASGPSGSPDWPVPVFLIVFQENKGK